MSSTMTIRLEDDTKSRLDKLAAATKRSRSFLAAEAIRDYVELNEWQVGEIRKALGEADRGEFAPDAEVKDFFDRWRRRAR
jgi:RHH-type transcriptional regulator, rel operon repressor / antitoxin RelB